MADENQGEEKETVLIIGVLTVSDSCFSGENEDKSGPTLVSLVKKELIRDQKSKVLQEVVPDEKDTIKGVLTQWADEEHSHLIFTTGGTGFATRDVTPEATREVISKEAPGLVHAMIAGSLNVTKLAMLSRPVCGVRNKTLIINLPGSPKGAQECFDFVLPALPHALDLLGENLQVVKRLHQMMQAGSDSAQKSATAKATASTGHVCPHKSKDKDLSDKEAKKLRYYEYIAERDRKSPYPMMSMDEAVPLVLKNSPVLGVTEQVPIADALGSFLGEDVIAPEPHPPFPASIKDGYAVIADDGVGDRIVMDQVTAGNVMSKMLKPGTCCRITTGAPVPRGADAVIQVEDTELVESANEGRKETKIKVLQPVIVGQDIRSVGFDIPRGGLILSRGDFLGPAELGLLATAGVTKASIFRKPVVSVLSTGNEIVNPGQARKPGQIYDANKTSLLAAIRSEGFEAKDGGIAVDRPNDLYNKLRAAAKISDIVITTGGVSMGEMDILKPVLQESLSAKIHFGRVHMKPGKPTTFATAKIGGVEKIFFALPGNPVSAVVTFYLFVLPAMKKMAGYTDPNLRKIKAKLGFKVNLDPRPEYHRAVLRWHDDDDDGIPTAHSTGSQCSSRLLSMRSANSLLILPGRTEELTEIESGTVVDAYVIGSL
eukprot:Seg4460.2 transcript_id=Seg4460.2/GoldUCD/mRNA.D3Y31 product=Gephyrin protein_id=Seg4460.2/GoldUCD/D3Y31